MTSASRLGLFLFAYTTFAVIYFVGAGEIELRWPELTGWLFPRIYWLAVPTGILALSSLLFRERLGFSSPYVRFVALALLSTVTPVIGFVAVLAMRCLVLGQPCI